MNPLKARSETENIITIIGGQRKWYQSVADELNVQLIHENGKHPERIIPKLKRSKAIFMMIEATSHKATYSCVEYAKEHSIPFYRIRGSRTQLREMILNLK